MLLYQLLFTMSETTGVKEKLPESVRSTVDVMIKNNPLYQELDELNLRNMGHQFDFVSTHLKLSRFFDRVSANILEPHEGTSVFQGGHDIPGLQKAQYVHEEWENNV